MKAWSRRDLTIIPTSGDECLVIACDSCGAIGEKNGDIFKISPRIAAKLTARVALTEVICSGAVPVAAANGVSCEMHPTGEETILGINDEFRNAGLKDIVLTGSTEENYASCMTALAITVIGIATAADLKFGQASKGDSLVLIGQPCVGEEVDVNSAGFYAEIRRMLPAHEVKEIVPVGSKGVAYEANILAEQSGVTIALFDTDIDYYKSAGPSTCLLALCEQSFTDKIPGILIGVVK